jgi:hypothetical protein
VHEELPQSVVDQILKDQVRDRVSVDHVAGHDPDLAVIGGVSARGRQRIRDLLGVEVIGVFEDSVSAGQGHRVRLDFAGPAIGTPISGGG